MYGLNTLNWNRHLTTIVWDKKVLAADRAHTGVFKTTYKRKIFSPEIETFFEGSQLMAFGGAGQSMYLNTFENMLLKQRSTSVSQVMNQLAQDAALSVKDINTSLLILTVDACYKVWLDGKNPLYENVTNTSVAIGSGARYARSILPKAGAFAALARAARRDKKTSCRIDWIGKAPGSKIKSASYRDQIWALLKDRILLRNSFSEND
jgi:ATP-dependent protease HslVU (ClpYQ) peptidase subunit